MNWREKYREVRPILGGAQGNCFVVSDINTGEKYFLKELKPESENKERRQRFIVETNIFKTLNFSNIQGIPKIIDCNTHDNQNENHTLYYCAEFIEGKNLQDKFGSKNITEEEIKKIFTTLLQVLDCCHSNDVVHRDIKPENIIFNSDDNLYLVDFGISYMEDSNEGLTETGKELGNRFLRLPELSAGSSSKRDTRSDLTFACAIALYMITKTYPRVMSNDSGKLPHQTPQAVDAISQLEYRTSWNYIFDKAFQCDLSKRWSNASEIMKVLNMMKKYDENHESNMERIKLDNEMLPNNLKELREKLASIRKLLEFIITSFITTNAKGFRTEAQQTVCNLGDIQSEGEIRIYRIGKDTEYKIDIIVELIGEQIVGYVKSSNIKYEVTRISSSDTIQAISKEHLQKAMHKKIADILVTLLDK